LQAATVAMLSDGSPKRTFCYATERSSVTTKCWYAVDPVSRITIGIDRPEVSMAELAESAVKAARDLFGYRGSVKLGQAS